MGYETVPLGHLGLISGHQVFRLELQVNSSKDISVFIAGKERIMAKSVISAAVDSKNVHQPSLSEKRISKNKFEAPAIKQQRLQKLGNIKHVPVFLYDYFLESNPFNVVE